ncbi:MAG: response regulator, partial [Planctomycetes bacterium]|nr:response regulator [Planctomycetota bacterium]
DAMPDGGEISIETMLISVKQSHEIDTVEPVPAGIYSAITVRDTGSGMDAETRSRLFEPFFTTKESGKGTGFGLVTVYTFVKQAKGGIRVVSAFGHGSSFTMLLPAVQEAPERTISNIIEIHGPPKTRQLLLIEDDDTVRNILLQVAESGGYDVIEANSGEQALEILNQVNGLDILVTDIVMPGISGSEVAAEARRRFPQIPVLYVSGYPRTELDPNEFEREHTAFLQKPFSHKAMLEVMDKLIELAPEPKIDIDAKAVETV